MKSSDQTAFDTFDSLPDSAGVRLPVVSALFGISRATVWRWSKSGYLPRPTRIGRVTFWNTGELRIRLKANIAPAYSESIETTDHLNRT